MGTSCRADSIPRGDDAARHGDLAATLRAPRAGRYRARVLKPGETAPDFRIGRTSLYEILGERAAVVFFFPRAFTAG
jgi:hypothetical protein